MSTASRDELWHTSKQFCNSIMLTPLRMVSNGSCPLPTLPHTHQQNYALADQNIGLGLTKFIVCVVSCLLVGTNSSSVATLPLLPLSEPFPFIWPISCMVTSQDVSTRFSLFSSFVGSSTSLTEPVCWTGNKSSPHSICSDLESNNFSLPPSLVNPSKVTVILFLFFSSLLLSFVKFLHFNIIWWIYTG